VCRHRVRTLWNVDFGACHAGSKSPCLARAMLGGVDVGMLGFKNVDSAT